MLGLGIRIFTDVRGIDKKSGSAVDVTSVLSTVTAKTTGKSVTSGGTLRFTPSPVSVNTNVNIVTTTKG